MSDVDFPSAIDSTMMSTWRACRQKLYRMYLQHWKPSEESVHLVAGKAFARGVEVARREFYANGRPSAECVAAGVGALIVEYGDFQCPADSAKSLERTAGALEFYFNAYPLGADFATPLDYGGKLGVEFSFAQPLPVRHPVTGDPILYSGRADMVAHAYGGLYIYDEKTTSSLGASWSRQWDMRSQFTSYCWALRQYGHEAKGVIVRGVSILKTKYDTQQYITYRPPWQVDRWLEQTCWDIEEMKIAWAKGEWRYNLDHSCNEYGGCALQRVCLSQEPEKWLPMYFHKRVWDVLAREEVDENEARQRGLLKEPA